MHIQQAYTYQSRDSVERAQDRLDRQYLKGEITQGEYDAASWALEQNDRALERKEARRRH